MLPIVDKPTVQYLVERRLRPALRYYLRDGARKRTIEDHFDVAPRS